nr:putative capsid protein [Crucivirus sp.]
MPRVAVKSSKKSSKKPAKKSSKKKVRGGYIVKDRSYAEARSYKPSLGRKMLTAGGGLAGSMFGPAGAALGAKAGDLMSTVLGMGAYSLNHNSLVGASAVPVMHSARDGVRVRHREFICNISSSSTFSNTTFSINPGMNETFPWLSAMAQNFEQYKFDGLLFEFVSTSADALNSTNTALGAIIMAAEYNATQPAYINKQQMENSWFAMSSRPSACQIMPIECDPQENPLKIMYIRTGDIAANQDLRMYDLGNFQIASVGSQAIAVVGELWATYDVVLYKPQLQSALGYDINSSRYTFSTGIAVTTGYFGTSRTENLDAIGLTVNATSITFPIGSQGYYLICYNVTGDSTALTAETRTLSNCTSATTGFAGSPSISSSGSTSTKYISIYMIYIADPTLQASITYSSGTYPANATIGNLHVTQFNGSY